MACIVDLVLLLVLDRCSCTKSEMHLLDSRSRVGQIRWRSGDDHLRCRSIWIERHRCAADEEAGLEEMWGVESLSGKESAGAVQLRLLYPATSQIANDRSPYRVLSGPP
jgi:hypothetical protein